MDLQPATGTAKEISELRERLHAVRNSVEEMEDLLNRYTSAEESLRKSEEQFRLLVTGVRDYAIFMLDKHGYIASWNTGAQFIKGYTPEEIIGRHFSVFYPAEDIAAGKTEMELEVAAREGVYQEEGWRVRKDGTLFWASVVITALYNSDGTLRGFGKVTRDLTERKRAEDAQRQLQEQELQLAREQAAREQAEANVRVRDTFLNATAHEFRTPVTSMFGYAQLLQRRLERGDFSPETIQKPLRTIYTQAQRLTRLTNMLLDATRFQHGRIELHREPFDLRTSIDRVVQELVLLTEGHTIELHMPEEPLMISGDQLRLEQVLYNLIQNAIKYSPKGENVVVNAESANNEAVLSVTDGGVGIPEHELNQVFNRFYRASNITHANIAGLGIGLFLVKEFVTSHGGTVEVESVVNQGSIFRVKLPLIS